MALSPIALRREDAAAALGVGLTTFKQHIAPELRVIRRAGPKLYPVSELQRWAEENAEASMIEQVGEEW